MIRRLRSLGAACGICLAATVAAQQNRPLDLRVVPVTEGNVVAVREVHISPEHVPPPVAAAPVGVPTDIEDAAPVGAVLYRPVGKSVPPSEKKWTFGAAGTPEMQARLTQSGYDVQVAMDDGERRMFRTREPGRFFVGQRVTVRTGELEPVASAGK